MKLRWWHISSFEYSEIVESDERPDATDGNEYGPFKTFSAAKADAIEYHRATKETAVRCIAELKALKKEDV